MTTPKEEFNCHLHFYTKIEALNCLDSIGLNERPTNVIAESYPKRFLFIGDSRGGQQFLNFLRVVIHFDNANHCY